MPRRCQVSDQYSANQAHRIGFKNIGCHACAVADIVTHVISDRCRIAWVVFVQVLFDFPDQIRTHIGGFGVNAATESSKYADERGA